MISSVVSILLVAVSARTAVRVLYRWNLESDSSEQIALEGETWLASQLIQLSLFLQIISLFLLMLAADRFAEVLVGAMCAAGAFLANSYGPVSLLTKLVGVFLYGFWVVLHRFDIHSEFYPLMKGKSLYLLLLVPVLLVDFFFTMQYVRLLEPDIITSCCGVLFGTGNEEGFVFLGPLPFLPVVAAYVLISSILLGVALQLSRVDSSPGGVNRPVLAVLLGGVWLVYFGFSLVVITSVISPYVYAMPSHRCPFDLLHMEYNYVGVPIYLCLLCACFFGSSGSLAMVFSKQSDLQENVGHYRRFAMRFCVVVLPVYWVLIGYFPVSYLLYGGEF